MRCISLAKSPVQKSCTLGSVGGKFRKGLVYPTVVLYKMLWVKKTCSGTEKPLMSERVGGVD